MRSATRIVLLCTRRKSMAKSRSECMKAARSVATFYWTRRASYRSRQISPACNLRLYSMRWIASLAPYSPSAGEAHSPSVAELENGMHQDRVFDAKEKVFPDYCPLPQRRNCCKAICNATLRQATNSSGTISWAKCRIVRPFLFWSLQLRQQTAEWSD